MGIMEIIMIVVFIVGYLMIALEHNIHIDKAPTALIAGMVCWAAYSFYLHGDPEVLNPHQILLHGKDGAGGLMHHMFDIANILFFLLGAMTIVETIDEHQGFTIITDKIKTTNKVKLLWVIAILSFFFSALLDNLTTAIVMISLLRKLVGDKQTRWLFAGMVIIAANAGGAWSVIGDVTTTMLWVKGQLIEPVVIAIPSLIIPSFIALLVPLLILTFTLKGEAKRPEVKKDDDGHKFTTTRGEKLTLLILGISGLLFVPIFKTLTHLPPFTGMMLSLGIIWAVTELMHKKKEQDHKYHLSVISVLKKVDTSSVLFFLGILLAVSALQEVGHLKVMAEFLTETLQNNYAINIAIGFLSSIVDNVPLVAASQGMYPIIEPECIDLAIAQINELPLDSAIIKLQEVKTLANDSVKTLLQIQMGSEFPTDTAATDVLMKGTKENFNQVLITAKSKSTDEINFIEKISTLKEFQKNGTFWEFLALCAGTGGSCLIIGSAAGVAVMGLEKIDFIWYMKKISLLAIVGYISGAATYILFFT